MGTVDKRSRTRLIFAALWLALAGSLATPVSVFGQTKASHPKCGAELTKPLNAVVINDTNATITIFAVNPDCSETKLLSVGPRDNRGLTYATTVLYVSYSNGTFAYLYNPTGWEWDYTLGEKQWTGLPRPTVSGTIAPTVNRPVGPIVETDTLAVQPATPIIDDSAEFLYCGETLANPVEMEIKNESGHTATILSIGPDCAPSVLGTIDNTRSLVVTSTTTVLLAKKSDNGICYMVSKPGESWSYTLTADGRWRAISFVKTKTPQMAAQPVTQTAKSNSPSTTVKVSAVNPTVKPTTKSRPKKQKSTRRRAK